MKGLCRYWKFVCIIVALATGYSLWLWRNTSMDMVLLISNILSVNALLFLLVGLAGLVHNTHALAIFTYSTRYLAHLIRNLRDRDELTNEPMIGYAEYVKAYTQWSYVSTAFLFFFIFLALSLLVWFLF